VEGGGGRESVDKRKTMMEGEREGGEKRLKGERGEEKEVRK